MAVGQFWSRVRCWRAGAGGAGGRPHTLRPPYAAYLSSPSVPSCETPSSPFASATMSSSSRTTPCTRTPWAVGWVPQGWQAHRCPRGNPRHGTRPYLKVHLTKAAFTQSDKVRQWCNTARPQLPHVRVDALAQVAAGATCQARPTSTGTDGRAGTRRSLEAKPWTQTHHHTPDCKPTPWCR